MKSKKYEEATIYFDNIMRRRRMQCEEVFGETNYSDVLHAFLERCKKMISRDIRLCSRKIKLRDSKSLELYISFDFDYVIQTDVPSPCMGVKVSTCQLSHRKDFSSGDLARAYCETLKYYVIPLAIDSKLKNAEIYLEINEVFYKDRLNVWNDSVL